MTRRLLALLALGWLIAAGIKVAAPASAMPLPEVVATIRDSGGHYQRGAASLTAADCSGLVSVAQSLAMGGKPKRLGNTHSLLAGQWPHAIPGATPDDVFIIGASRSHMSAQIDGVRVEATCCGRPFKVGPGARDPFTYPHVFHVNPEVLA
ncbi:hypothetical protein H7I53_18105 [Mycolicibacterium pulveris]|uniref:Peptidoglycan endopeptidase n=1 Tax=Mycolicibacterium pulveris TaxID=36813 RepID=A0A7I7UCE8_MYCPV|nr:hypothetical protein [Mycolicibacterium pulveris]MCV6982129.1 hypothetical protein [Mycolicibacterium pulveris]BBY78917.1 hypothetical protein MPUL_00750 [Mycolicibacterium pulveris]